jgi:MFS family permease
VQRAATRPGVERLGLLFAALGAGGGLSAWWVNTAGHATPRIRLVGALLVLAGGGVLLFAATNHFGPMLGAAFLMGLATAPILLVGETLLQGSTEPGMRGRVFATRDFTMRVVLLASVTLAAACTRSLGERWALGICGALVAGAGLLAVGVSRREVR